MSAREKLQAAALATAVAVGIVGFVVTAPEDKCVKPECDETEKEVDCYRVSEGPFLQPERKDRWVGCNVFPKKEARGSKCVPAACVEPATKRRPRILE